MIQAAKVWLVEKGRQTLMMQMIDKRETRKLKQADVFLYWFKFLFTNNLFVFKTVLLKVKFETFFVVHSLILWCWDLNPGPHVY